MSISLPKAYKISPRVSMALRTGKPVVALETTVLTHGLPYPKNLKLAEDMEAVIQENRAEPATIGLIEGRVKVGMEYNEIEKLVSASDLRKISRRDYGVAIARKESGGRLLPVHSSPLIRPGSRFSPPAGLAACTAVAGWIYLRT